MLKMFENNSNKASLRKSCEKIIKRIKECKINKEEFSLGPYLLNEIEFIFKKKSDVIYNTVSDPFLEKEKIKPTLIEAINNTKKNKNMYKILFEKFYKQDFLIFQ